jgi:sigma-E factor negative regulatory protein RseA
MSEQIRESLSALMDGEAGDQEIELLLQHSDSEELRETWRRYHLAQRVISGPDSIGDPRLDVSQRVREALGGIDQEPVAKASSAGVAGIKPVGRRHNFLARHVMRPAASFAVAASVFASVLVGAQWYGLLGGGAPGPRETEIVSRPAPPVGMVNTYGGSAMAARYAAPALRSDAARQRASYNRLARQRLQHYLLPHTEEAALNSPQGMMPYARLASYTSED